MTDIRPNTKIESEIFPKELSKAHGPEAHAIGQEKDVFTPPDHQQLKFAKEQPSQQLFDDKDDGFFITEDPRGRPEEIDEEHEDEHDSTEPHVGKGLLGESSQYR